MAAFASTDLQDEEWCVTPQPSTNLSPAWINALFPTKADTKRAAWLQVLLDQEFETISDLQLLDQKSWEALDIPLAVRLVLQKSVDEATAADSAATTDTNTVVKTDATLKAEPPVSQVDCIVIDISGSMKARSAIDADKTREDVSKLLFHTLVDKLITLELEHVVGLLAFGASIIPVNITRDYERFHDELGRLDATQNRTKLYDSILSAADMIETYVSANSCCSAGPEPCRKRIFVLTDGQDNASESKPWEVARELQNKGIQLDAIPLAGSDDALGGLCTVTGGLCFHVMNEEQGIGLFEREATLHLAYREEVEPAAAVTDSKSFNSVLATVRAKAPVTTIRSAASKTLRKTVMTKEQALQAVKAAEGGGSAKGKASLRRIMKEYAAISASPIPGVSVYVAADDAYSWKVVMSDLPAPYTDGAWLLTVQFPSDYPFRPPRVKFVTPVYHCNVSVDGHICLDTLKDAWSPALSISRALEAIRTLLINPKADDPLDAYKGQLYRDDKDTYMVEAARHTASQASESVDELVAKYACV